MERWYEQDKAEKVSVLTVASVGDLLVLDIPYIMADTPDPDLEYFVQRKWVAEIRSIDRTYSYWDRTARETVPFHSLKTTILSETLKHHPENTGDWWNETLPRHYLLDGYIRVLPVPWEDLPLYVGLGRTSYRYEELLSGSLS